MSFCLLSNLREYLQSKGSFCLFTTLVKKKNITYTLSWCVNSRKKKERKKGDA